MNKLISNSFMRIQQIRKGYISMLYNRISLVTFCSKSKIEIEDLNQIKAKEYEENRIKLDPLNEEPEMKNNKRGRKNSQTILSIRPKEMDNQIPQKENPEKFHNIYTPENNDITEYEDYIKKRTAARPKKDFYIGDTVKVIKGDEKDLNKIGVIKQINSKGQVKITGVNLKEHFNEPQIANSKFKKEKNYPKKYFPQYIDISNIMLVSPHTNDVCKPNFVKGKDKTIKRFCPKTNKVIPFPEKNIMNSAEKHINYRFSILDTPEKHVRTVTYKGPEYDKVAKAFLDMIAEKKNVEEKLILKDKMIKDLKL